MVIMAERKTSRNIYRDMEYQPKGKWGPDTKWAQLWKAASKCLKLHIPFAVCHIPGNENLEFFCGEVKSTQRGSSCFSAKHNDNTLSQNSNAFIIGQWLSPWRERISINASVSFTTIADDSFDENIVLRNLASQSTYNFSPSRVISKEEYLTAVSKIINNCKARNGKTVYSRIIPGENHILDITFAARKLFNSFYDSFGFLYYTPITGCWLGASPESLLDFNIDTRLASTMAFAGTRSADAGNAPWDEKNLRENLFVADYIQEQFRSLGIEPKVSSPYTIGYGSIQHLRRDITAYLPESLNFTELLDKLNPTPALCGTPLNEAIADINQYELHKRECYGGFVGVYQTQTNEIDNASNDNQTKQQRSFRSFVNLRSARISTDATHRFEIIAGGGIIADSNPQSEWAETEAKSSRLKAILTSATDE